VFPLEATLACSPWTFPPSRIGSTCRAAFAWRSDPSRPPSWPPPRPPPHADSPRSASPTRTSTPTCRAASPSPFLVKALARHAVTAWEGVGDATGKPLPLSPEAVERLMDLDDIAAAFWDRATAPVAAVAAEGNG
jgi:hypothetical protein